MAGGIGKKERSKYGESDDGKEMFCLWRFWTYHL